MYYVQSLLGFLFGFGFLSLFLFLTTSKTHSKTQIATQDLARIDKIEISNYALYSGVNVGLFLLLLACTGAEFSHWLVLW